MNMLNRVRQLKCNHSFGHQNIKLICTENFHAKTMAELGFVTGIYCICQCVVFSNTVSLSKLAKQLSSCHVLQLSNMERMLGPDLSAMHKSLSRCRRKGDSEADEDIPCSMKDGGSHSPRPQWWHYIDPAALETWRAQAFGFVSTVQHSVASPLNAVRKSVVKTQTKGSENADVYGARQVGPVCQN